MDRFMMYISMGYPSPEDERRLLASHPSGKKPRDVKPVLAKSVLLELQKKVDLVSLEDILLDYILSIITATRSHPHLSLGVSPRGGLALQQAARARALVLGRDYCIPDDIKQLAVSVLGHRVIPRSRHDNTARRYADTAAIINEIVEAEEIPI